MRHAADFGYGQHQHYHRGIRREPAAVRIPVATDRSRMEDQYAAEFRNIFRLYQVDDRGFEGAVLGSVVPPLDNAIRRAVKKVTGLDPLMVGPGTKTGIDIRIDNPAQLGADLLVGAVAAVARYGPPAPCGIWAPPPRSAWWMRQALTGAAPLCRGWAFPWMLW